MTATFSLQASLALSAYGLSPRVMSLAMTTDPLRLDLPPLIDSATGTIPSSAGLRTLATLYLQAEFEQTGIVRTASALVDSRNTLGIHSETAARKLEIYYQKQRDWYDTQTRDLLFARLFGIGSAATHDLGTEVNRTFTQQLAMMCLSIVRYSTDYDFGQQPSTLREAALRQAISNLLLNLGARQFGNTLFAGRRIHEQLQQAIEILNDSEIGALFNGQGLWSTLRAILGADAPDVGRLASRAQSGQRLLNWLAEISPILNSQQTSPLLAKASPVFSWAAIWLQATGIATAPG